MSQSTGEITQVLCAALIPPHAANPEYQAVPLLPTSNNNTSQHDQEGSKSNPDVIATASASAAPAEEAQPAASDLESSSQQQPMGKPSRIESLWKDGRIRTGLLLLAFGIINHFC